MSGNFFFFFFFFFFFHVRLITTPCQVFNNCAMSGDFLPCKAYYRTISCLTIAPCQAIFFFFFFFFSMLGLLPHHVRCSTTAPCQATFCHVRLITAPCQVLQSYNCAMSGWFFFFFFHVWLITTPCQVFNNCAMSGDFLPCKANNCTMSGVIIVPCRHLFFFLFFFVFFSCKAYYLTMPGV